MTRYLVRALSGCAAMCCAAFACNSKMVVSDADDAGGGSGGTTSGSTWTGNAPDCPATPPHNLDECQVAEGQFCAYWWQERQGQYEWRSCGCWEASSTVRKWSCVGGANANQCPTSEPATGADCDGHVGSSCRYPERTECRCQDNDGSGFEWLCSEYIGKPAPPPPTSVDPNTSIPSLSDPERDAWCQWYLAAVLPEGSPEPTNVVDSAGYASGSVSAGDKFMCAACIPWLSRANCMSNLSLSTCAAPISELTDCVSTIVDACFPSPHGCARYLERPGCSGTIVVDFQQDPGGNGGSAGAMSGCTVKVQ